MARNEISIEVAIEPLDEAIEKANRLVKLLREATQIIDSLFMGERFCNSLAQQSEVEIKKGLAECEMVTRGCSGNEELSGVVVQTLVKQLELLHERSEVCAECSDDRELSELTRSMSGISECLFGKLNGLL